MSPDGSTCRFCPTTTPSTSRARANPITIARQRTRNGGTPPAFEKLYRHDLPDGNFVNVKRVIVSRKAELITAFCTECARELDTQQVLCYQRTLAKGRGRGTGCPWNRRQRQPGSGPGGGPCCCRGVPPPETEPWREDVRDKADIRATRTGSTEKPNLDDCPIHRVRPTWTTPSGATGSICPEPTCLLETRGALRPRGPW